MKRSVLSMLEILCVAALLLMFGAGTFALVTVGSDAYSRLSGKRESTSDMRVASSYISMKVRRCDEAGAVSVRREPDGDVLVLASDQDGEELETRIYLYDGMLREAICYPDEPFEPELGFEVVTLDAFDVGTYVGGLTFTLTRAELTREFSLGLRSGSAFWLTFPGPDGSSRVSNLRLGSGEAP